MSTQRPFIITTDQSPLCLIIIGWVHRYAVREKSNVNISAPLTKNERLITQVN